MNVLAALIALVVFVGVGAGALALLASEPLVPSPTHAQEHCAEEVGERVDPAEPAYRHRVAQCVNDLGDGNLWFD
jgi:hypothetical protein